MADDQQPEFGLVMPFVTVASKGGPWDDGAYCAGWAMGLLDAKLEQRPSRLTDTIRTVDVPQADLLAMKHGYRFTSSPSELDEWAFGEFVLPPAVD